MADSGGFEEDSLSDGGLLSKDRPRYGNNLQNLEFMDSWEKDKLPSLISGSSEEDVGMYNTELTYLGLKLRPDKPGDYLDINADEASRIENSASSLCNHGIAETKQVNSLGWTSCSMRRNAKYEKTKVMDSPNISSDITGLDSIDSSFSTSNRSRTASDGVDQINVSVKGSNKHSSSSDSTDDIIEPSRRSLYKTNSYVIDSVQETAVNDASVDQQGWAKLPDGRFSESLNSSENISNNYKSSMSNQEASVRASDSIQKSSIVCDEDKIGDSVDDVSVAFEGISLASPSNHSTGLDDMTYSRSASSKTTNLNTNETSKEVTAPSKPFFDARRIFASKSTLETRKQDNSFKRDAERTCLNSELDARHAGASSSNSCESSSRSFTQSCSDNGLKQFLANNESYHGLDSSGKSDNTQFDTFHQQPVSGSDWLGSEFDLNAENSVGSFMERKHGDAKLSEYSEVYGNEASNVSREASRRSTDKSSTEFHGRIADKLIHQHTNKTADYDAEFNTNACSTRYTNGNNASKSHLGATQPSTKFRSNDTTKSNERNCKEASRRSGETNGVDANKSSNANSSNSTSNSKNKASDATKASSEPSAASFSRKVAEKLGADFIRQRLPNGKIKNVRVKQPKQKTAARDSEATEKPAEQTSVLEHRLSFLEKWESVQKMKEFMSHWAGEIWVILWNVLKLTLGIVLVELEWVLNGMWKLLLKIFSPCVRWCKSKLRRRHSHTGEEEGESGAGGFNHPVYQNHQYLTENIKLPESGEEAMKRLLDGHGKDPYSILGLKPQCTDEEIKRYFRRQAVLVHPDKNKEPGADEAFKILNQAVEILGDPERRKEYDAQSAKQREADAAMGVFSDMLTKLKTAMQEAMDMLPCQGCGGKHKRVLVDRPLDAARYCATCDTYHSAREGDVWAESTVFGFLWNYYSCMDNQVYSITKWASCQVDSFRQLQSNSHTVTMKISTGNRNPSSGAHGQQRPTTGNPDIDELLSSMFRAGGRGKTPDFSQFGSAAGTSSGAQSSGNDAGNKRKKKKRR